MIKPTLTGLKKVIKPYLEEGKNLPRHIQTLKKRLKDTATDKNTQKKLKDLSSLFAKQWKTLSLTLAAILTLYYGIGAAVSSHINNSLEAEIKKSPNSTHTIAALSHALKTQVDDAAWVPALPIIFPAAILDNLPNFQIGVKESVRYFTKKLAAFHADKNLKEAATLLDYPANIWLFSQTNKDKLAPGSAKQYRKAIAKLADFTPPASTDNTMQKQEFKHLLNAIDSLLERQINRLSKQVLEHNSEMLDFNADNIFYHVKGAVYTTYYVLSASAKDYQNLIVDTNQYEHLTSALRHLKNAEELSPLTIQNGSPEESYTANHLLYLAYHLSLAQNQINKIRYAIKD